MFNWGYALIGFGIGFATSAAKNAHNTSLVNLFMLAMIAFLIFSATFGIEWFFMAIVEVIIGAIVGIKMSK